MFGDTIDGLGCRERTFTFRFRSAEGFVEYFRDYYGPTLKAFEAVGDGGADQLFADLVVPRAEARRHLRGPGRDPRDVAGDGRHAHGAAEDGR